MLAYRLAPRTHVCATDDGAVLLDVEDDKYLSLDPSQAWRTVPRCRRVAFSEGWRATAY